MRPVGCRTNTGRANGVVVGLNFLLKYKPIKGIFFLPVETHLGYIHLGCEEYPGSQGRSNFALRYVPRSESICSGKTSILPATIHCLGYKHCLCTYRRPSTVILGGASSKFAGTTYLYVTYTKYACMLPDEIVSLPFFSCLGVRRKAWLVSVFLDAGHRSIELLVALYYTRQLARDDNGSMSIDYPIKWPVLSH